jgi:hypothetical protein
MARILEYGPEAFLYLLALAAQVSGYTSPGIAIALTVLATVWLVAHCVYKWRDKLPQIDHRWLAVSASACITAVVFIFSVTWYFWHKDVKLPGLGIYTTIRLYDTPEFRRRYVYEFVTTEGAKASFSLSSAGQFTFAVTDIRGEIYPLEIKLGENGLPIDRFVALFFEVGLDTSKTLLRVRLNKKVIAQRTLTFKINLGSLDWHPGSLGAPILGQNQNGVFLLFELILYKTTFTSQESSKLVQNISDYLKIPFD